MSDKKRRYRNAFAKAILSSRRIVLADGGAKHPADGYGQEILPSLPKEAFPVRGDQSVADSSGELTRIETCRAATEYWTFRGASTNIGGNRQTAPKRVPKAACNFDVQQCSPPRGG